MFSAIKDFLNIFYPNVCIGCSSHLNYNHKILCLNCLHDLPRTYYSNQNNNPIEQLFFGKFIVHSATSLLNYDKNNITKKLIHELKYKKNETVGLLLGELIALDLLNKKQKLKIDYIIPVPLHPNRLKKRGYNQLTELGKLLSEKLNTTFKDDLLIKKSSSETQTKKNRLARWKNAQHTFELTDKHYLKDKHILLLDDVITTGSTIESCAKELLKTENISLSIVSIAHTINF